MGREKLKIAILYDTWDDGVEEPTAPEMAPPPGEQPEPRSAPARLDRDEIFEALRELGHRPSFLVIDGRDPSLLALARCKADLVFNLTESYAGDDTKDVHVAAYLDLLGKHYTGAGPHGLYLAQDKALAKKLFAFHGIRTPAFAVSRDGEIAAARDIGFPLIVKPIAEDGSIGIEAESVVRTVKALRDRIAAVHEEFGAPALIEEYVDGREIYAAILGEETPEALPLVEMDLSGLPRGVPRIASGQVKWGKGTAIYRSVRSRVVEDLDAKAVQRIQEQAVAAYRAVQLRDYGRIDLRLTPRGEVYVIEANPNPWLSSGAEFAMAARASGRTYTEMLRDIVDLAMARRA